ncbi:MAG: hypothetical protein U0U67_10690 [Chitinophagales bacterium]
MKKELHLIVFVFLFIYSSGLLAQNERSKSAQKEAIAVPETVVQSESKNKEANKSKEAPKVVKAPVNSQKTDAVKTTDKTAGKQANQVRKTKVVVETTEQAEPVPNNYQTQNNATENFETNVTYTKEDLSVETAANTSERKPNKIQKSVNYQPKVVKEDIHPVTDYTNSGIAPNKKIYLQQEADDLEREIQLNANNPNYDIAAKQKQLDEIKKLIGQ